MLCWTCTLAQVEVEREAAAKVVAAEGMAAVVARGWEVEEMGEEVEAMVLAVEEMVVAAARGWGVEEMG